MSKKKIWVSWLVTVSVALMALTGCVSRLEESPHSSAMEYESVIILKEFNNSFQPSSPTRGKMNWASWCAVVTADAHYAIRGAIDGSRIGALFGPQAASVGGVVGAVVYGSSGSYIQYGFQKHVVTRFSESTDSLPYVPNLKEVVAAYALGSADLGETDYELGEIWNIPKESIEIGILHNKTLSKIGATSPQGQTVALEYLSEEEQSIVESEEFENLYVQAINLSDFESWRNNTRSDFVEAISENQDERTRIENLFYEGLINSVSTMSDLNRYISMYSAVVLKSSSLSEEDIKILTTCFSVAGYSFDYWSNVWPYVPDDEIDNGISN